MQKRLTIQQNMPITYQALEEFIANENDDLNRQTSIQLNNRNEEEQIIDMEEMRFIFFACATCKKYNYPFMHLGLSDEEKQMISLMNQQNHSDQLFKLLDYFQTDINKIRQRNNCKATVPYITELTVRLLFAALNPKHDNNKPDGINNLRCLCLANELDPPIPPRWSFKTKSSALSLLTHQIFEYCKSYECVSDAKRYSF